MSERPLMEIVEETSASFRWTNYIVIALYIYIYILDICQEDDYYASPKMSAGKKIYKVILLWIFM